MTIFRFLGTTVFLTLSLTSAALAGGIAGGGGPPSLVIGLDKLRLILDQALTPEIILNWDGDLPNPVTVGNVDGDTRSYRVYEGAKKGSYLLIDRREVIRSSVKNTP